MKWPTPSSARPGTSWRANWAIFLLQVIYHGQMGAEAGHFDTESIARRITAKMIDRHPHVFGSETGEQKRRSANPRLGSWPRRVNAPKRGESPHAGWGRPGASGPFARAETAKAPRTGRASTGAIQGRYWTRLAEEIAELNERKDRLRRTQPRTEFGDILFVLVNLARHWGVDPEAALRRTNAKVERRFAQIEDRLAAAKLGQTHRQFDARRNGRALEPDQGVKELDTTP